MNFATEIFNNREKALIVWAICLFVWALFQEKIRTSLAALLEILFSKKIVILLTAMLLYILLIVFLFYKMRFWDYSLMKDTIYWTMGTAFVMTLNFNKANQDDRYFNKLFADAIKMLSILTVFELIIDLYTFSFLIELILQPILAVILIVRVFAEIKGGLNSVKKLADSILWVIGAIIIVCIFRELIKNPHNFANMYNAHVFLLLPALTIMFLPFVYFLAVYAGYENIFVRLDMRLDKDNALNKFAKHKIFNACFLNLKELNRFFREKVLQLGAWSTKDDIVNLIQEFKSNRI